MTSRIVLRAYGWVFAVCGALFVLAGPRVLGLLNLAVPFLPHSAPFEPAGPSLWLGLTGSMMAMIAALSFALARDPDRDLAWSVLLLSKACSTALFAAFALAERNTLFLLGSACDGAIFVHLAFVRAAAARARDPFAPRLPSRPGPGYEAWFAKFNDPATRRAVWLRCEAVRDGGDGEASWGWVVFEPDGKVTSGRLARPLAQASWGGDVPFRLEGCELRRDGMSGRADGVSWDVRWTPGAAPVFRFVPRALAALGLAGSDYATAPSLATFDATVTLHGRELKFAGAPGCVGHLGGARMPADWRWVHAVLDDGGTGPVVFELLSARVRLGPWTSPRLTAANLWRGGRHLESTGVGFALTNASRGDERAWTFQAEFPGGLRAEGECAPGPVAELEYASPDGRRLRCRNSKTGRLTLRLDGETLVSPDAAAVEWAETAA